MAITMSTYGKRYSRFVVIGTLVTILTCSVSPAQQRTVTGTVRSDGDGLPLPGANVAVQGTFTGTITDLNGYYSLQIPDGDVSLQFSYIGFTPQLIPVGSSTVIDVMMAPSLSAIDEVVITSLGITREKKRITYSAQNVEAEKISQARELNPVNSLQGKVAGLDIIRSNSGVGSATRVLIRGNRSIAGNNQPLYIVDGVPFSNHSWGRTYGVQWEDGIGNLNPDDIATVTVLKGPNATALYGARASNGAVVITTKKGLTGKGIGVEFNTNFSMDKALILTRYQHVYGQGNGGVYIKNSEHGWGAKMDEQMVEHWSPDPNWAGPATYAYLPNNNFEEFFVTGYNFANTLTLTSGSDKLRALFSYTNTNARGIVETNKLRRNNIHFRFDGNLTAKFSFDCKLTYFNQNVDNRIANGDGGSIRAIYLQPSNISLEQARDFEYFDNMGIRYQHYWNPSSTVGRNIYWMLNRVNRMESNNRIIGLGSLRYQFTKGLSLMIRSSFDHLDNPYSYKEFNNTWVAGSDGELRLIYTGHMELNNDFLLNYKYNLEEILSFDVSFGGNMLHQKNWWTLIQTNRLNKPNLFVITNTNQHQTGQGGSEKKVHSLYGFATIGLMNFLFLDITGRNDWSSTLPKENWSYFYPSVGLTWIITDMLKNAPSFLTFAKVRANYAEVGNDTDPYLIHKSYEFSQGGNHGYIRRSTTLPADNLKPENTRSIELGADIKVVQNRLGLDFTWYKTNTFNQLLRVPLSAPSGYSYKLINAGNMQNQGIEIILHAAPVRTGDFSWDIVANFAKNENLCVELTDELDEYTTPGGDYLTTHKIVVGEPYDQIYTRGFIRNEAGRILINELGLPVTSPGKTMQMGHFNPDWTAGLTNTLNWKGLTTSVLVDVRMGGDVFSLTEANLTGAGYSEATLEGRDGFVVDGVMASDGSENTIETTAEQYWLSLGGRETPVGEPFRYDASFVRIREVVIGYAWELQNPVVQSIELSLYGRNLGFLYNASKIMDPGMSLAVGNYQGVDGFNVPTSRTFGINAKFKF
jgi:TonB-linked SusC/RagA family outer membrane protein